MSDEFLITFWVLVEPEPNGEVSNITDAIASGGARYVEQAAIAEAREKGARLFQVIEVYVGRG